MAVPSNPATATNTYRKTWKVATDTMEQRTIGSVEYRGHTLVSDIDTGYAWDSNDSDGGSWEES